MTRWWIAVLWAASVAHAQMEVPGVEVPGVDAPAKGELVVEHESVAPGGTIRVGVRVTMEPMWHVYWSNPGDSGMPAKVTWTLPRGVTTSPLRWPAPHRIPADPLMTYGYEDEVLLSIEVSVPSDWKARTIKIGVRASWLVCAEVCLEGGMATTVEIAVREDAARKSTEWGPLFARTRESLPRTAPEGAFSALPSGLVIDTKKVPLSRQARVYFFPLEAGWLEQVAPQTLTRKRDRALLGLPLTASARKEDRNRRVRGVLVVTEGKTRRAFVVDVPVIRPKRMEIGK